LQWEKLVLVISHKNIFESTREHDLNVKPFIDESRNADLLNSEKHILTDSKLI
jgi:hypothetical protein